MHDVIIIGAGFAGCSAAREVRRAGREPLILEARDRIGGRTWTQDWDGQTIERGGGWVHWLQPHVWTEVVRSGLTPLSGPAYATSYWVVGDEIRSGTYEEREAIGARAWNRFVEGSHEALPLPHDPLARPGAIARIDGQTILERINELGLSDEERAVLTAEVEALACGYVDQAGALSVYRWHALSGHDFGLCQEAGGAITIAEGTVGILSPILAEARAELRLNAAVAAIRQAPDHVVVTTRAGEELSARAVVVTAPLNTLDQIDYAPRLSEPKRAAIAVGQASSGIKVFIRVRGTTEHVLGLHPDHPIGFLMSQWVYPDGTQTLIGFGRDHSACRVDDLGWMQEQVARMIPGLEVLATSAHDWQADEFSRGTWAIHRPGWYTSHHAAMQEPEGRIIFAGGDIANGWAGFMDGAIESGTRGGRLAAAIG